MFASQRLLDRNHANAARAIVARKNAGLGNVGLRNIVHKKIVPRKPTVKNASLVPSGQQERVNDRVHCELNRDPGIDQHRDTVNDVGNGIARKKPSRKDAAVVVHGQSLAVVIAAQPKVPVKVVAVAE